MKIIYFIFIILAGGFSYGQSQKTMVEENRLWSTMEIHCQPNGNIYSTYSIRFEGDTIIEGKDYRKVMHSTDPDQLIWTVYGFIREDDEHKVYIRPPFYFEGMIYDFGCVVGDTLQTWNVYLNSDTLHFVVTGIDSVLLNDGWRKKISLFEYNNLQEEIWVEGLGSYFGVLNSGNNAYGGVCGSYQALCFQDNGTLIYQHPDYSTCYYASTVGAEVSHHFPVNIYPNPAGDFVTIDVGDEKPVEISIYSVEGKKLLNKITSDNKNILNLQELDKGIYIVRINTVNYSYAPHKLIVD